MAKSKKPLVRGSREQLDAKDLLRRQNHPLYENLSAQSGPAPTSRKAKSATKSKRRNSR